MRSIKLRIDGNLQSKSNSRRLIGIKNRVTGKYQPRSIKSRTALEYQEDALWQLAPQLKDHQPFTGDVGLKVTVYYQSKRNDLDISLLMDILEKSSVYGNDRQVREYYARKEWDKEPHLTVEVYEL